MRFFSTITLLGAGMLAELLAGNLGLIVPVTAFIILYFSAADSLWEAMLEAIVCGTILDVVQSRPWLISPGLILAILLLGKWLLQKDPPPAHPLETGLAGMGSALLLTLGVVGFTSGLRPGFDSHLLFWQLLFNGAIGLVTFPLLVFMLDSLRHLLDLPTLLREARSSAEARSFRGGPRRVDSRTVSPHSPEDRG